MDFSAFHQMHRPRYVREAERCLRCRADAEEAVDEAFVQLAQEWRQILRTENPAAYAWRVVKNRVIDHARARGRRATLMDTAVFETVTLQGAEDAFEVIEQNLRLFHAIAALPERQHGGLSAARPELEPRCPGGSAQVRGDGGLLRTGSRRSGVPGQALAACATLRR
ncbi:hypothetical protein CLM62_48115 [Streptomyces sp. SA15]|nr:hypothetical protein CLM62_48115 [Streptomyces sp. SA15]